MIQVITTIREDRGGTLYIDVSALPKKPTVLEGKAADIMKEQVGAMLNTLSQKVGGSYVEFPGSGKQNEHGRS